MKMLRTILLPCVIFFFFSCNDYTPKPKGYIRIEQKDISLEMKDLGDFSFSFPSNTIVEKQKDNIDDDLWFNITYPEYNSVIYCTYMTISEGVFSKIVEDNYRLVYAHTQKADGIKEESYSDPENHIYGTIYNIKGAAATPIQFYVTDSTSHFLRGSLYFEEKVNIDSVAPIVDMVRNDILELFKSLKWKEEEN